MKTIGADCLSAIANEDSPRRSYRLAGRIAFENINCISLKGKPSAHRHDVLLDERVFRILFAHVNAWPYRYRRHMGRLH